MIEVEIKNFQAIDSLKLQVEGFTTVVGRTNIGKSSIVRALKCALSGGSGSDFVRHDARTCARLLRSAKSCKCAASVKLTFGEGQALLWEKSSKGLNRYTVWKDGVVSVYDKVGQGAEVPELLETQFAPVKLGPNHLLLQVASQFDAPFLLDLSGTVVADILGDIGQLDDINQAMASVSKDRRAAAATRKVRESDIETLNGKLVRYGPLDAQLRKVRELEERGLEIQKSVARAQHAERLITAVGESVKTMRGLNASLAVPVPDATGLSKLQRRLVLADDLLAGVQTRRTSVERLGVALEAGLPSVAPLRDIAIRWAKAIALEKAIGAREASFGRLSVVDAVEVPPVGPLRERLTRLTRVAGWLQTLEGIKAIFAKAGALQHVAPPLAPMEKHMKRLAQLDALARGWWRLEKEVEHMEQELAKTESEAAQVLTEFSSLGLCPTCHQGITPGHVIHA